MSMLLYLRVLMSVISGYDGYLYIRCELLGYLFFFFKQKTAYEMLRSLVGSEMCIRDRSLDTPKLSIPIPPERPAHDLSEIYVLIFSESVIPRERASLCICFTNFSVCFGKSTPR